MTLPLLAGQHARARALLPPDVYGYYAAGAADGMSAAEAADAWAGYRLRPRVLRDVGIVDTATTLLGQSVATPVCVAPSAAHGGAHPDAEVATAAGAQAAGSLFCLSCRSSARTADIAAAAGDWWQQVYVLRDRGLTRALVDRAVAHGAGALVLTVDTPVLGPKRDAASAVSLGVRTYDAAGEPAPPADARQDRTLTPAVIGWLAGLSALPVVVKGVLRADDARTCVAAGAAAVLVSNHGGRQLDRAIPTAAALPEVVEAVGGNAEVYVDGGIRDGIAAMTALALGARAVFVGRPVLWALAADGARGVTAALAALTEDLRTAMALAGAAGVDDLDASLVSRPGRSAGSGPAR